MVFSTQKERIHTLLKDTITLLCKNGLSFDSEFSIEALIGITLDKQDVFLVNINEIIRSEAAEKQAALDRELEQKQKTRVQSYESSDSASSESESLNRKRRKRKKNHDVKTERPDSGDDNDSNAEDNFCSSREHADLNNGSELQNKEKAVRNPSQTKGAMLPHGSIKRDMEEEDSMDDIIVIKEEVGEDWSQFCESNNFPSTSDPQNSQMSHTFPSATSTFTQSGMENSSFDWSSMATQGQFPPNPSASGNEASQPGGDSSQQFMTVMNSLTAKYADQLGLLWEDQMTSSKIVKLHNFAETTLPSAVSRLRLMPPAGTVFRNNHSPAHLLWRRMLAELRQTFTDEGCCKNAYTGKSAVLWMGIVAKLGLGTTISGQKSFTFIRKPLAEFGDELSKKYKKCADVALRKGV